MILKAIDEVVARGGTGRRACERLGLPSRTIERWRSCPDDMRHGPQTTPRNKLSAAERKTLLELVNTAEFRDLPPGQIIPRLADKPPALRHHVHDAAAAARRPRRGDAGEAPRGVRRCEGASPRALGQSRDARLEARRARVPQPRRGDALELEGQTSCVDSFSSRRQLS